MKKAFLINSIVIIILSLNTIFTLFLFRYINPYLLEILFYVYLLIHGIIFFVMALTNLKKDKILFFINTICLLLTMFLFIKCENVGFYINTHYKISNYLKEKATFKGAKIVGIANDNLRINGQQYSINYIYNIKMPDNKIIQGYFYQDTTGPFGGYDRVETNYLYHYKDELVSEYNQKYNRNIDIDFKISNQYVIEAMTYTMGSKEEILDFVDFVKYKAPTLEYDILIYEPNKQFPTPYNSKDIHHSLIDEYR